MHRPSVTAAAVALLAASALAQGNHESRLLRVTAPFRHAGVYHVATGTWTRGARLANLTGPDVIYDNSCFTGYFARMITNEDWYHRSRVPTTAANGAPTTASLFYGAPRRDETPGSATSYLVNGFQFAYCSSKTTPFNYRHGFADSYTQCSGPTFVPEAGQSFNITGLPGGTPTGGHLCWVIDVDLDAATQSFELAADGNGVYVGPSTSEQFGWMFGPTSITTLADATGPIIAGNYTWTGGPTVGALTPCTGTDGSIWDCPVNLSERGTGMASNDFFRTGGTPGGPPSGPGCYFFGGTVHADFYLKLFADTGGAGTDCSPMAQFCRPGQGAVISCPCGNPPAGGGLGCDNFGAGPVESGTLGASGEPSLSNDTLLLEASGENDSSLTVFWQGRDTLQNGVAHGAGVRCVATFLKRLYTGTASAGAIVRPGTGDPSVSARSSAVGDPIGAGASRHYFTIYRDPNAAGPCGSSSATINLTNAGTVTWYL